MSEKIYRIDFVGLNSAGVAKTFRYATKAYVTLHTHATIPSTFIDGRLKQPLLLRRDMYGSPGKTYGEPSLAHGTSVLENGDGGLDDLLHYGFDAQVVKIWRIDPLNSNTETLVFSGVLEQAVLDDDRLTLMLRDETYSFDRALQPTKYAGTGGIEGDDELKDRPKPICLGTNYNLTPILVDESKLIYQVHDGALNTGWFVRWYDSRVILTAGAVYASQADMEANAPSAGQYRVWPGGGCIRLGSTPVGITTADVTNPSASGLSSDWWNIVRDLFVRMGLSYAVQTDVQLRVVGVYFTEEITFYAALREVLKSVNASMQLYPNSISASGVGVPPLYIDRLEMPSASAVLELNENNITPGSLKKVAAADVERGIPPWRIILNHYINRTPMKEDDLAGSVISDRFAVVPNLKFQQELASVKTQFPLAPEMTVDTLISDVSDASQELLDYWQPTYMGPRVIFQVEAPIDEVDDLVVFDPPDIYGLRLNDTVKLTHPRFNLDAGEFFSVLGYTLDYDAGVAQILLWGEVP